MAKDVNVIILEAVNEANFQGQKLIASLERVNNLHEETSITKNDVVASTDDPRIDTACKKLVDMLEKLEKLINA